MATGKLEKRKFMDKYSTPVILIPLILIPFLIFAFTRFSDVTTYIPFSGEVFNIDVKTVEEIRIKEGTTGDRIIYHDDAAITEIADYLNAYRYDYWVPDLPIARSGWSYAIVLCTKDGEYYDYTFTTSTILIRGVWYSTNTPYFEWLVELVEEYGQ